MNKRDGSFKEFINFFESLHSKKDLSFYFITAHPGSNMEEAKELAKAVKGLKNVSLQVFSPTPLTMSTCMYYTGMDPVTKQKIPVPYTYHEKKEQKRIVMRELEE